MMKTLCSDLLLSQRRRKKRRNFLFVGIKKHTKHLMNKVEKKKVLLGLVSMYIVPHVEM